MIKPKIRSKIVDGAIKKSYAKLARAHFERAEKSIGSLSDLEHPAVETDMRMRIVERYLEIAGAEATKSYF